MTWGITLAGFARKHLTDLMDELQSAVKDAFGSDKRVDAKSPIGILVGIFAQPLAEIWEVLEGIWSSFDPDSAVGAALDNLLAITGMARKRLIHSTVTEEVVGVPGTQIPEGSIVETDSIDPKQFETTTSITLGRTAVSRAYLILSEAVTSGHTYSAIINGRSYSTVATGGSTTDSIIEAIIALIEAGPDAAFAPATYIPGTNVLYLGPTSPVTLFSVSCSSTMSITGVGNFVEMAAIDEGAIPAYAGTLTTIITPVTGWLFATNEFDASLGRSEELDSEARARRADSLAYPGSTTVDSLRAKLLNISGVTNCTVLTNREDAEDANGLAGHSDLIVIQGGSDTTIAQKIWDNIGGGISMNIGNANFPSLTVETVVDSEGVEQSVAWQRPSDIDLWVRVTYTLNAEEIFPDTGEELIGAATLAVGYTHQPGQNVVPERFRGPVFAACKGIATLLIETAVDSGGTPGAYSSSVRTIAVDEIARFDPLRVVVTT